MNKDQLRQLRHLKREIELLQDQIINLESEIVTDKVRGSDPEHPYTEKRIIAPIKAGSSPSNKLL